MIVMIGMIGIMCAIGIIMRQKPYEFTPSCQKLYEFIWFLAPSCQKLYEFIRFLAHYDAYYAYTAWGVAAGGDGGRFASPSCIIIIIRFVCTGRSFMTISRQKPYEFASFCQKSYEFIWFFCIIMVLPMVMPLFIWFA